LELSDTLLCIYSVFVILWNLPFSITTYLLITRADSNSIMTGKTIKRFASMIGGPIKLAKQILTISIPSLMKIEYKNDREVFLRK